MANPLYDGASAQFANLLETCPIVPGAIVSKPLLNLPTGKVVVFAMDAGQEISEHRAPFVTTVHVLDGRLRFWVGEAGGGAGGSSPGGAGGGQEREMGPQDWLVMPASAPHRLAALEATRFVLTMVRG